MANLITNKQKKIVKNDYRIRLMALSLLMASLLGAFLLAYIISYYISVSKKDLMVAEQFKSVINIENKENIGESAMRIVNKTNDELKAVELYNQENLSPAVYFSQIIASKNTNIKITKLSFGLLGDKTQLLVGGVAKDRDGLVAFIDKLKTQDEFASVESPLSDFAKDRDIVFTLNIKTNK